MWYFFLTITPTLTFSYQFSFTFLLPLLSLYGRVHDTTIYSYDLSFIPMNPMLTFLNSHKTRFVTMPMSYSAHQEGRILYVKNLERNREMPLKPCLSTNKRDMDYTFLHRLTSIDKRKCGKTSNRHL